MREIRGDDSLIVPSTFHHLSIRMEEGKDEPWGGYLHYYLDGFRLRGVQQFHLRANNDDWIEIGFTLSGTVDIDPIAASLMIKWLQEKISENDS